MPQLSYCAERVRRLDRERFLCAQFAPAERREALFALYAFNLEVATIAEVVSEPLTGQMRLQWWRDSLDRLFAGDSHHHPVAEALAAAIGERRLSRDPFDRLLDAREFDLEGAPPADVDALAAYAEGTSATLSMLSLEVLGVDEASAREAARHVGIAWGLVGLLRAVPFHAAARRVYLPLADCRGAGFEPDAIADRQAVPGLAGVVAGIAERASDHLREARVLRRRVPRRAAAALLPAVLADRHLSRLRGAGHDPFRLPAAAPATPVDLLRLAAGAWTGRY